MRVVLPTNAKKRVPPPIALARPEPVELQKGEYLSLKLQSTPGDADSQTYELSIPYFSTGTPEQWLKFVRDLNRVLVGQNLTTGPSKYQMARRLLDGDALAKFEERATANGAETNEHFRTTLNEVTTHVFPKKALAYQKRYMRREMRKPRDMKTRAYVARVNEINAYLRLFPPFDPDQELPDDKLMDIFEYSIPNTWQKQATIQGFDIMQHTPSEFVEFCERLESVEDDETPKKKSDSNSTEKNSRGNKRNQKQRGSDKHQSKDTPTCMLHGPGHSTEDCKVLRSQAKRMKATYDAQSPPGKKNWKAKNEANAIIDLVTEKVTAEFNKKKRKEVNNCEADFSKLRVGSDTSDDSESD